MKLSVSPSRLRYLFFLLLLLGLSFFFARIQEARTFSADGYDPYYHMAMAKIVAERGVDYSENWLAGTIFETAYGNTLLGFHVLGASLLSLSPGLSLFAVSEAMTVALALSVFLLIYATPKGADPVFRLAIVALMLASGSAVFRTGVFRPQLLGYLFFFFTLFSLSRRSRVLLFLSLLAHMLSHTSFPFSVVVVLLYLLLSRDWSALSVLVVASIAFFLVHPDSEAILLRQQLQVVDIPFGRVQKGAEWMPSATTHFVQSVGPLLFISFVGLLWIVQGEKKAGVETTLSLASLPMLFYAAAQHSRFHANLVLLLGLVCGQVFSELSLRGRKKASFALLLVSLLLFWRVAPFYLQTETPREALRLNTARWLSENSPPSRVLNDWDAFPVLFYASHYGYSYSAGLDPMYLYFYSPIRYSQYMQTIHAKLDIQTRHTLVKDVFGADYVVLDDASFEMAKNPYFEVCLKGFHGVLRVK